MTIQLCTLSKNAAYTLNLLSKVDRPGIDNLITYLLNSNYFDSPASTKYHNNFYGGLNQHCINVYKLFVPRNRALDEPIPEDSEIIVSLCHDLCKVGYYYFNGDKWKSNKQHQMSSLHGVLSVQILKQFIELTPEEEAIIKYHMGLFSVYGYTKEYSAEELHEAISKYVAVQVFASCDNEDAHARGGANLCQY